MFVHGSYEDQTQGNSVVFRYGKETSVLPRSCVTAGLFAVRTANSRELSTPRPNFVI